MKVITLLNEKGGVGKTTTATHLAAGLAIKGYRVILIDTDAQANTTSLMRVKSQGGLYQLLVHEADWKDVLQVPARGVWGGDDNGTGSLLMIDSNLETRVIPMLQDDVSILKDRLDDIADIADVVVIDTSPTPSMLHAMIYLASDYMVYPTQPALLSLQGLGKSVSHMARMQQTRRAFDLEPTHLLGVLPTMYRRRTDAHEHGLKKLCEKFGDKVWEPITMRTVWEQATYAKKTLFAYAPEHEATQEAWGIVEHVLNGVCTHG